MKPSVPARILACSGSQTMPWATVVNGSGRASEGSHLVRVTFQRIVRRTDGSTRAETLKGEELYRDFYERLSKSVFLEAHKI